MEQIENRSPSLGACAVIAGICLSGLAAVYTWAVYDSNNKVYGNEISTSQPARTSKGLDNQLDNEFGR